MYYKSIKESNWNYKLQQRQTYIVSPDYQGLFDNGVSPVFGNQGFSYNSFNRCKTIDRWVATLMKTGCARTASCLSETGHGLNPTVSNCALALPQNVHHYTQLYQTVPQLCPNVPYCTLTVPHCTPTVPNCTTPRQVALAWLSAVARTRWEKEEEGAPASPLSSPWPVMIM